MSSDSTISSSVAPPSFGPFPFGLLRVTLWFNRRREDGQWVSESLDLPLIPLSDPAMEWEGLQATVTLHIGNLSFVLTGRK